MRVLLVEDDVGISRFIHQGLNEAGYAVDVAQDGCQGIDYAIAAEYDAIILDILLPKMDGISTLKHLRQQGIQTPVLLLTACNTVQDRVLGLDAGADDYLIKPFDFTELLARLRALLRRPPLQVDVILQVGNLEMDTAQRLVKRGDRSIELSPREFSLLEYLMRNPNQVLSRTQIAQHVWSFDFYGDFKVIDVYIGYLRRKIDRDESDSLIHTIRGVGYRMSAESKPCSPDP
ncbi:MAG: response regulator transcription factor [Synechococcales cyanobacterium K44_A2020_017]|jgi:DNA-binding response OmpR family regulator|uniref:response regulator transcription factor n=1 Tax=Leptolyngbya sp. CCY15150 TaxID=2767772 RepID=UPI00194DE9FC|nr:response regulator transcription factor [Leptolyngbya sp. CCY15150]MBF2088123.1 response regulator transcription factor [Synechococcales cyanobacterium K32_A2020_035]MBF2095681.1 response regulator transcription factor [Synechococcales cyanobacterium K44_A2020_017]